MCSAGFFFWKYETLRHLSPAQSSILSSQEQYTFWLFLSRSLKKRPKGPECSPSVAFSPLRGEG